MARGGHRLLANHASARDDTPRSATHATRTSSTSAAPAQRIVPMRCPRPLHSAVSALACRLLFPFQSSRVASSSHSEHHQITHLPNTHVHATSARAGSVRRVYARRKRSCWVPDAARERHAGPGRRRHPHRTCAARKPGAARRNRTLLQRFASPPRRAASVPAPTSSASDTSTSEPALRVETRRERSARAAHVTSTSTSSRTAS